MLPNGNQWSQMVPNDKQWYPKVPNVLETYLKTNCDFTHLVGSTSYLFLKVRNRRAKRATLLVMLRNQGQGLQFHGAHGAQHSSISKLKEIHISRKTHPKTYVFYFWIGQDKHCLHITERKYPDNLVRSVSYANLVELKCLKDRVWE